MTEKALFPQELIDRRQWVLWNLEDLPADEETGEIKQTKLPFKINGNKADATDATTWAQFAHVDIHKENYSGVGFVLSDNDPYTAIDLDDCIINGKVTDKAMEIVKSLNSYTEISQSGTGLHIFVKAKKAGSRSKNSKEDFEMYDKNRFMVMTGNRLEGTPFKINEAQETVNYLYDMYFPKQEISLIDSEQESPSMSDEEVINIASNARNQSKFAMLMDGDSSNYGSQSEADQALCYILACYTQDPVQINRIFSNSGLYREKWDREDYKNTTIKNAINNRGFTYKKKDFKLNVTPDFDLKKALQDRRLQELENMQQEWEESGSKGRPPKTISPIRCAIILQEYVNFILFDLEEDTRVAMYQPDEGIYTRNTKLIRRVISWLEPTFNSNKADDVIYHLTNRSEIKEETNSRYLIPVKNGVYNLETKQLESFTPDYVFTSKIQTAYKEVKEKPIIDGWDVEEWMKSIACYDKEIIRLLWEVISDSLNGNFSRKKAIFLVGQGNNGKGTFQELITNLIGISNIATLKINEFEQRFKLGVLEGKTAVIGDDVPANVYVDDSSNFNSVVTGDRVSIEVKNKQPYGANFKCSVIQSTNGMPKFRNKTVATERRLLIVPFDADFNTKEENFKIKEEYIKNQEVLEYVLYHALNMDFEHFTIPEASQEAMEDFKQDNDPVYDFKTSEFDTWEINRIHKFAVYVCYKDFCDENGYKPLSERMFHKHFKTFLSDNWKTDAQGRIDYGEMAEITGYLSLRAFSNGHNGKNKQSYERKIGL